jgi:flavin reductase (DIM6/NTAB) family NADH-FMN oxidoreductase RutF
MEFMPLLVGGVLAGSNHSFHMIRKSGECVINLPTTALTNVVGIGNTTGAEIDEFEKFAMYVHCLRQDYQPKETVPTGDDVK